MSNYSNNNIFFETNYPTSMPVTESILCSTDLLIFKQLCELIVKGYKFMK